MGPAKEAPVSCVNKVWLFLPPKVSAGEGVSACERVSACEKAHMLSRRKDVLLVQ